jgi:hypothetical protein
MALRGGKWREDRERTNQDNQTAHNGPPKLMRERQPLY